MRPLKNFAADTGKDLEGKEKENNSTYSHFSKFRFLTSLSASRCNTSYSIIHLKEISMSYQK